MSDKKTEVKKQPEEKKQMDLDLLGKLRCFMTEIPV